MDAVLRAKIVIPVTRTPATSHVYYTLSFVLLLIFNNLSSIDVFG